MREVSTSGPTKNIVVTNRTTSPYFSSSSATRTTTSLSSNTGTSNRFVVSSFFLRSPSSVYGSVQSLGPLIYTWASSGIDRKWSHRVGHSRCCCPPQQSTSSQDEDDKNDSKFTMLCNSSYCKEVIDDALRHFDCCPIFQQHKKQHFSPVSRCDSKVDEGDIKHTDNNDDTTSSSCDYCCIERVGYLVEHCWVRHLCPNQCFLRAFAPSRDWMTLRRTLAQYCHQTDNTQAVDVLLKDWTCRLVAPGQHQRQQEQQQQEQQEPPISTGEDNVMTDNEEERVNQVSPTWSGCESYYRRNRKRPLEEKGSSIAKRTRWLSESTTACRTEFVRLTSNADEKPLSSLPEIIRELLGRNVIASVPEEDSAIMTLSPARPISSLGYRMRLCFTSKEQRRLEDGTEKSVRLPVQALHEKYVDLSVSSRRTLATTSFDRRSMNAASPLGLLEELFVNEPWRLLLCTIFLNRTQRKQVDCILYNFLQRWPTPESLMIVQPIKIVGEGDAESSTYHYVDGNDDSVVNSHNDDEAALESSIAELISPMGMTNRRAPGILRFCKEYLSLLATKQRKVKTNTQQEEPSSSSPLTTEAAADDDDRDEFTFTRKEICSLFYCGDYAADAYQLFIQQDYTAPILSRDHALLAYSFWKRSQRVKA